MSKVTVTSASPTIARVLGVCDTDTRIVTFLNEATERMLVWDDFVGTFARYTFCVRDCCLTLPRQIESIRAFAVCCGPGTVHNDWYEFLANGPGQLECDDCLGPHLLQRGDGYVTHTDITGTDKVLRVVSDQVEVAGLRILLRGFDELGAPVMTQDAGAWIEGEYVAISTTPTLTTKRFTSLTQVIKPVTASMTRVYSQSVTDASLVALAQYEPDETLPNYRRIEIPGIEVEDDDDDAQRLTVLAKVRFVPVRVGTDFLQLGNINALKLMVMAIRKEEQNLYDESIALEAKARMILEAELSNWYGPGPHIEVRTQGSDTWGGGSIINAV